MSDHQACSHTGADGVSILLHKGSPEVMFLEILRDALPCILDDQLDFSLAGMVEFGGLQRDDDGACFCVFEGVSYQVSDDTSPTAR